MMSDYVLIGEQATSPHAVFELRIWDHLPKIDPKQFGLTNVPSLNPADYYITSGDAISKAVQLVKDLTELLNTLRCKAKPKRFGLRCICGKKCSSKSGATLHRLSCIKYLSKLGTCPHTNYEKTVALCLARAKQLILKLRDAKGPHCFLETEWVDHVLKLVPKNPRSKVKDIV